ncbi:MAG: ABC transporter substrate-binding protein [Arcobacter sp.]|nr:ABC transporter substrate-binding protein [Arcobacter sp.]
MWLDQFQFAGFYVAVEKGFYKDIGLEVELKKYDLSMNIIEEVLNKNADFGTSSSSLIVDKSNGKDIVLLGSIFQSSPLILLALENSNINYIEDMKNKSLMITQEQQKFATFKSMLNSKGVRIDDLKVQEHSFNVDNLINRNTDLMLAYITNEPFILKEKGYKSKIFAPKDYGFDFYEGIIFTSKEFALNNPKLVKDFYSATIRGWEYAFENIDEVAKLIYEKYNPQNKTLKSLIYEANEMKKLVYDKHGKIGTITPERINLIINTYRVMGLLENHIDVDDLIYTDHLNNTIYLSNEEKLYLNKKEKISVCVDPNWMPLEKIENGKHIGISADYLKIIQENIQIPISLVPTKTWSESMEKGKNKECDIFSLLMPTPQRETYLNFTKSYLDIPLVLASKIDTPFINDLSHVRNKKLAIVKDYAYAELLKIKFPDINFIDVQNVQEGLSLVEKEKVYGFIGSLLTVGYQIQNNYIGQLKISAKFDETFKLGIAVRNDDLTLLTILNKAISNISEQQKQEIINKWISINLQKEVNYTFLNKVLVVLLIFIVIFVLIYREYLLKKLNKELLEKVAIEINKNEEKNRILIQQSRMASMGEMLENIAHQWRQPLSTISVCASGIEIKKELEQLSDEEFFQSIKHIKQSTTYLSNTIDDFRNFFSEEKTINKINLKELINRTLDLVSPSFNTHNIKVIKKVEDINFLSLENELVQVLMNILVNSKDALKLSKKPDEDRIILINAQKQDNNIVIEVKDNANGIDENIIDKIFEPYFTTKHQFNGTGIGLYMSKLLVEKHLKSSLKASNTSFEFDKNSHKGAIFTISIPLENEVA